MRPDPTNVANRFAKKWKKLPPGWTDESVKKFWKTLGKGTPEHKVWNCIEKMDGHIPNTGAFCGGLADWQMPGWREKNKKESPEARSDAKSYWKGKIKKKMKGKKASEKYDWEVSGYPIEEDRGAVAKFRGTEQEFVRWYNSERFDDLWDDIQIETYDIRSKRRLDDWAVERGRLEKLASAQRVALRYAARHSPPSIMGSANMLKRQGLTPVDVWFGEVKPHRRPMLELGDMVQTRGGDLMYFAGVASDGGAILGKNEREAERLHKQVIEDRKHHSSRAAFGSPLMLQPDYGHGDAAVPDGRVPPCQQGYHPCQHGLPCECGGGCGK